MQQKWSVNARLDWALFWTMNLNQKNDLPAVGRKLISKSQQPENLGRRYYFLFVTMEGIRRNLEKSCLDLIDFLSASDSIDGVSVISDYELNRATNYGVPDRLDVNVADRGDADRNPISLLLSARARRPPPSYSIPRSRKTLSVHDNSGGICLLMNHSPPPSRTDSFRFPRLSLIHSGISQSLLFRFPVVSRLEVTRPHFPSRRAR